jgi:tetratricopeptide (TPR) repeat protein
MRIKQNISILLVSLVVISGCGTLNSIYIKQGHQHYDKKDYAKAAEAYSQAIAEAPNDFFGYMNRAYAYVKLKKIGEARADWEKVVSLKPDESDFYYQLGKLYMQRKKTAKGWSISNDDYRKAAVYFTKVIELKPSSAGAYLSRGICNWKYDDYKQCFADYQKALEVDPSYKLPLHYIARYYQWVSKDEKKALKYYKEFLQWKDAPKCGSDYREAQNEVKRLSKKK